jgi:hypothetical protein
MHATAEQKYSRSCCHDVYQMIVPQARMLKLQQDDNTYQTYAKLASAHNHLKRKKSSSSCKPPYPIPLPIEENSRLLQHLCIHFFLAQSLCKSRCICMNLCIHLSAPTPVSIQHVGSYHVCRWRGSWQFVMLSMEAANPKQERNA